MAPKSTSFKPLPIRKWVVFIILPIFVLIVVAILQVVVHFALNDTSTASTTTQTLNNSSGSITTGVSSLLVRVINLFSILLGTLAVLSLVLMPIWIVMLVKTVNYNTLKGTGLNKTAAIVIAILFGFWTWLYTYERDKSKFWGNLIGTVVTAGLWGIAAWIWAIIDTASKPEAYYSNYPSS